LPLQPLNPTELALLQSLEILNTTIQELCRRRDILAAQLPKAPKQSVPKYMFGLEVKQGGMDKRKIKEPRKAMSLKKLNPKSNAAK